MEIKYFLKSFILVLLMASTINAGFLANVTKSSTKIIRKFIKSKHAFSSNKIAELARIAETKDGIKKIGKILGKMNLPKDVLEDTYARIAVYRAKISSKEMKELFKNLRGTEGFRTTLRKIIGNNLKGSKGHLNELKIANSAYKNSFKVLAIGKKFNDGIKKKNTDIDILLKRKNKVFAIESKDYLPATDLKLDKLKGDIDSLVAYKNINKDKKVIPIFTLTNKPNSENKYKLLQKYADKKGVQLIIGTPEEQIQQIKLLGDLL